MTIRGRAAFAFLTLLVLSLALNLFGLGVFVALSAFEREAPGIARVMAVIMAPFPQEVRRDLRRQVIEDRHTFIDAIGDLREARENMFAVMRAEPFDEAAVAAAMMRVREQGAVVQELAQTRLIRVLAEAGEETRQKIAPPEFPDLEGLLEKAHEQQK